MSGYAPLRKLGANGSKPSSQKKTRHFGYGSRISSFGLGESNASVDSERSNHMSFSSVDLSSSVGQPLPPTIQDRANTSFGTPLGDVRVHSGEPANRAANKLSARAFTLGRNIYFKSGMYEPKTHSGLGLIGHELSHVIQQRSGAKLDFGRQANRYEREADLAGARFANCQRAPAISTIARASTPHLGGNLRSVQRSVEGAVKIKDSLELFTPEIGDSVGRRGANQPKDVTVVQMLLNGEGYSLDVNGIIEANQDTDPTAAAIEAYQRRQFPTWKESDYDGRISLGKKTWGALTGTYFEPDTIERPRTQFDTTRNIMLSPAVIGDDKALIRDREAAAAADIDVIPAKGANHVEVVLQKYYDMGISIDNLYISSHGGSWDPYFKIGNGVQDKITRSRISSLSGWKNLMGFSTKLIVTACHVGGGEAPEAAKAYTKELASTLGVTVYTSRSWVASSEGWTFQRGNAASLDKPAALKKYLEEHQDSHPNKIKFLGEWLEARPGREEGEDATVRTIVGLEYDGQGGVREAEERFPDWSEQDLADYEELVRNL